MVIDVCCWVIKFIFYVFYVIQLDWIIYYGCKYVVYGDDIIFDGSGEDCYCFVKVVDWFKVVKWMLSIFIIDLVGRMLFCMRGYFIKLL